ncbi:MAG: hypothetical protein HRF49_02435 [bacterium]
MAAKSYPRWALAAFAAAIVVVAVSFAFVFRETVVRSRMTVEDVPEKKAPARPPAAAFNPFPADLRGPIPEKPPAETDYAKLVELEEGLKTLEYPSAFFLYDALCKTVPETSVKAGAPLPSSVRQLAKAGFLPFSPPDAAMEKIDEVLAVRGWIAADGGGTESPVSNWSDAERTMYMRALIGSAALDAVSAGARASGALKDAGAAGADALIALSAPGFAARADVFEKWFGAPNPAFWVNPFTGGEMKNVPPSEPEEAKKGNFFAETLPDGSVRLRFYIR